MLLALDGLTSVHGEQSLRSEKTSQMVTKKYSHFIESEGSHYHIHNSTPVAPILIAT